jgi:hypothetical protein
MVWIIIPATVNSVRLVHVSEDIYESNLKMGTRARKHRLMRLHELRKQPNSDSFSGKGIFVIVHMQQLNFFNN